MTPGSIPQLTMRRSVLGKDTLHLFPIEANQSTRCGGPADETLAKRAQKRLLRVAAKFYLGSNIIKMSK